MKQYPKHYPFAITDVNKHRDLPLPIELKTAKRAPAGGFVNYYGVGSFNTHVLTSELQEKRETLINEAFKEWEKWLSDYRLRQLKEKPPLPFTPTDF